MTVNPTKPNITMPFSGRLKPIGIRLPVEVAEYMQTIANVNASNMAQEIRSALLLHLRDVGVLGAPDKEAKL